ncbi:Single-pass membrane and coiled-coil domain-containing protein 4 homolog-like Protein [Tribolium castaneum]|uniref:Single-pass membrane and coiled-coil domain-containing protein 4 homolog n=1 Tax=Tribolium castaneum TaxID=7070 RepID=D6WM20_TRICA|nr:PREDICTED: single-pass membrane and coiled-coil domain-containing protein 4 [Tribolium castaneum]EFA04208.2 Single-pass membrane and coiled-coil domain-containing protein 4 homolog-like Protein [Tribolium castaneum]|eukprot:XP_015835851.1 PREDICTED: single-pass membrane and coiled-coil domain-containing protein 4 [Tribolium castaneum]
MRQLKGGKQKETAREKKQRKKEFAELQKQVKTIVLPALAVSFILIVVYVYLKTRPSNYNMD